MGWLVTGRIFDNGRVPVVSVLVMGGLGSVWRFRRSEVARAVPAVGLLRCTSMRCFDNANCVSNRSPHT